MSITKLGILMLKRIPNMTVYSIIIVFFSFDSTNYKIHNYLAARILKENTIVITQLCKTLATISTSSPRHFDFIVFTTQLWLLSNLLNHHF